MLNETIISQAQAEELVNGSIGNSVGIQRVESALDSLRRRLHDDVGKMRALYPEGLVISGFSRAAEAAAAAVTSLEQGNLEAAVCHVADARFLYSRAKVDAEDWHSIYLQMKAMIS